LEHCFIPDLATKPKNASSFYCSKTLALAASAALPAYAALAAKASLIALSAYSQVSLP
jgi:hypothetical protein